MVDFSFNQGIMTLLLKNQIIDFSVFALFPSYKWVDIFKVHVIQIRHRGCASLFLRWFFRCKAFLALYCIQHFLASELIFFYLKQKVYHKILLVVYFFLICSSRLLVKIAHDYFSLRRILLIYWPFIYQLFISLFI